MSRNLKFFATLIFIILLAGGGYAYKQGVFSPKTIKAKKEVVSTSKGSSNFTTIMDIASINPKSKGSIKTIKGTISNRIDHSKGHVFLTLSDSTGEIQVPIFADKKIDTDDYQNGKIIQVKGKVDVFNGKVEVIPEKAEDIKLVESEKITKSDIGKEKNIKGTIISKYAHPTGHLFIVLKLENEQEMDIPLFKNLQPNSDNYPIGSLIELHGKVTEYKGKLEIVPSSLNDISILKKGNDLSVQNVELKNIGSSDRGRMVITNGFVKSIEPRDDGNVMFTMENNGAEIKAVLFRADSQENTGRKQRILNANKAHFAIRILGMVDVYEGQLEIVIDKVLVD
ncbi:OB-fold nucleic acid binding domain-containing protein [Bacillus sp. OV166]|uniref:OB-fold nucleic acid binding domain-containing protein n=1 Tax=Bacillus sp. OV166 TaxID=1882763 RepID=UPI000A2AB258|nr:OB-fold nucleic acid binding domain-containing protein [Bacillus sp. OV166]SMQ77553.1 OB-fold nucleic acid binding domain-containing protein [Bacillus sp. OV166]